MSQTKELFRENSYAKSCEAKVTAINDLGGIILDRTVFYPSGGGQPGDAGTLKRGDGSHIAVATTVYEKDRSAIVHVPAEGQEMPAVGETVQCIVDWNKRFAHMRVHTALHLLCAILPYPVTGGSIGEGEGRLDFDIPDAGLDKEALTEELNKLIEQDHEVSIRWITDEELEAQPDLVRTMAVKPPMGTGKVRLIAVGDVDLQPCGGTHVGHTNEIGTVEVSKIEKKGAKNRRVRIAVT
ncbi:MAG: alanyl-tRNA editing protein [Verrucomicrobiota bacterium]